MHTYKNTVSNIINIMIPLMLMQSLETVSAMVDAVMIGRYDALAIGGVTLANTFYMLPFAILMGILFMSGPLMGQAHGAENKNMAVRVLQSAVLIACMFLIFLLFLYGNIDFILSFLWFDDITNTNISDYMSGRMWGAFMMLAIPFRLFLMNFGFMKTAVRISIIGMPVNIICNYMLIYGNFGAPEWGVYGAGLASSISVFFVFLGMVLYATICAKSQKLHVWQGFPIMHWETKKRIFLLGIGFSISIIAEMSLFTNLSVYVGYYDPVTISAFGLITNFWVLMFGLQMAMGETTNIYLARNAGKRDRNEILRGLFCALGVVTGFSSIMAYLSLNHAGFIFYIIVDKNQVNASEIVAKALPVMPILAIGFFMKSYMQIFTRTLMSLNDTQFMPYALLVIYGLLGPSLAYYFVFYTDYNLQGIFATLTILVCIAVCVAMVRVRYRLHPTHIFANIKT